MSVHITLCRSASGKYNDTYVLGKRLAEPQNSGKTISGKYSVGNTKSLLKACGSPSSDILIKYT